MPAIARAWCSRSSPTVAYETCGQNIHGWERPTLNCKTGTWASSPTRAVERELGRLQRQLTFQCVGLWSHLCGAVRIPLPPRRHLCPFLAPTTCCRDERVLAPGVPRPPVRRACARPTQCRHCRGRGECRGLVASWPLSTPNRLLTSNHKGPEQHALSPQLPALQRAVTASRRKGKTRDCASTRPGSHALEWHLPAQPAFRRRRHWPSGRPVWVRLAGQRRELEGMEPLVSSVEERRVGGGWIRRGRGQVVPRRRGKCESATGSSESTQS